VLITPVVLAQQSPVLRKGEKREPSNAARIYASNTTRPGWRRFEGAWVLPAARMAWSDVLRLGVHDRQLDVDVLPTERAANLVRSDRQLLVEIDGSPAVWAMTTKGRVWVDWRRRIPSCEFSATATYDRGFAIEQIVPETITITRSGKTFVGIGRMNDLNVRVTCSVSEPDQRTTLKVENSDGKRTDTVLEVGASNLFRLRDESPMATRQYVVPLLRAIAGENPLRPEAADVYRVFSEIAADENVAKQVGAILPEMDSPAVEDRNAASASLEKLGDAGVLAVLRMDRSNLSPEQRGRVDRFVANHTTLDVTPEKAKADPFFLLDCLEDGDHAVRVAAKSALEKVSGKSIEFPVDLPEWQRAIAIRKLEKIVLADLQ
jgi:hypothetical protein